MRDSSAVHSPFLLSPGRRGYDPIREEIQTREITEHARESASYHRQRHTPDLENSTQGAVEDPLGPAIKPDSILIVDDSLSTSTLLRRILIKADYEKVKIAPSAESALDMLFRKDGPLPDLILMDFYMREIDGVRAIEILKNDDLLGKIPVIMVTGKKDMKNLEAAFTAGAIDYISKPVKPLELIARVRSALRLKFEIDTRISRENELKVITQELEKANRRLHQLSTVDSLTDIPNRRLFDETFRNEYRRLIRGRLPLALLIADIDLFKKFNDTYGHQAGDTCLQMVARKLKQALSRPGDFIARYGGEEFIMILPNTSEEGALTVAERAHKAVAEARIRHAASPHLGSLTISIGACTTIPQKIEEADILFKTVDDALYEAKRAGGNRSVVLSQLCVA